MLGRRMIAKTGGPALVVDEIVSDHVVMCTWMDPMGQRQSGPLALCDLEHFDDVLPEPETTPAEADKTAADQPQSSTGLEVLRQLTAKLRTAAFGTVSTP